MKKENIITMDNNKKKGNKVGGSFQQNFSTIPAPIEIINSAGSSKKWVDYGVNNLYPLFLISLIDKSSLHSAILKQKSMFMGGGGWSKTNISENCAAFMRNIYNEDDLDEILFKIAQDLEIYGGFFLNLIWSKDKTKIVEVNYIDPSHMRISEDENTFWKCDDWSNTSKHIPVDYPAFRYDGKGSSSQILYTKEHRPGTEFYAKPEYTPGIRWMLMDYKISNWHLFNIDNGFSAGMVINFPIGSGLPDDEMEKYVEDFKREFYGDEGQRNVILFSDTPESKATFEVLELNTSDARFLMLNDNATDGVLKAHRVTDPELFGIKTPGQLGPSGNSLIQSLEVFSTAYIYPKQRLIEKVFNRICRINGIDDRMIINRYQPQFSKINIKTGDVLNILSSDITPKQKYHLLIANDYDHATAANLSDYREGNIN
jgi:hypothetical protein